MSKAKIIVAGIGPGSAGDITPAVLEAVRQSDVIIGYQYYFQFVEPYVQPGTECVDTGMLKESVTFMSLVVFTERLVTAKPSASE